MYKTFATVGILVTCMIAIGAARSGETADQAGIKKAAMDYMVGYYNGDADRMESSIHPDMAKRVVMPHPKSGKGYVQHMSAMKLVQATRYHGSKPTSESERTAEVEIYEVYGNAATVKGTMHDWVDYMHMVKLNGQWKIINVLWELTPEAKKKWGLPKGT